MCGPEQLLRKMKDMRELSVLFGLLCILEPAFFQNWLFLLLYDVPFVSVKDTLENKQILHVWYYLLKWLTCRKV